MTKTYYCKCGHTRPKGKHNCFVCADMNKEKRLEYQKEQNKRETKKLPVQDKSVKTCVPVNTDAVDPHYFALDDKPNTNYHWLLIAGIVLIVVGVIMYFYVR